MTARNINGTAMQAEQGPTRKARRRRKSAATLPPVAVSDGVARVAARRTTRITFRKLGVEKRVRSLVAAGNDPEPAAEHVAKTAKGILAERELAASISARAGLVSSPVGAHPNPIATHPALLPRLLTTYFRKRRSGSVPSWLMPPGSAPRPPFAAAS